ncbi:MAG: HlyD family efflux transporter periplasmic adaptor subunit [Elainellaceae cyanobacterium]
MGQLRERLQIPFRLRPGKPDSPANKATPKRRLPRWLPYALVGFGIAVAIALAFRPSPVAVDLGTVVEAPLQVTVDAEGKTRVQERYVVSAPVAGRLQRLDLEAGDPVEANAAIARLDPLPLNSQVRAAQARLQELQAEITGVETQRPKAEEVAQAEARLRATEATQQGAAAEVARLRAGLEQARRDRRRAQDLEAEGAVSRQAREAAELTETRLTQELSTAQRSLEGAIAEAAAARSAVPLLQAQQRDPDYLLDVYRAQIAAVEAELSNLADEARRTTLAAPVTGRVLQIPDKSARFIEAGEPVIELGDPSAIELVVDVLSADAVQIEPGDGILVEQWGGHDTLAATVTAVEPSAFTEVSALGVEEQRVNVIGAFDGPAPLGDGYRVEARIVVWASDNALQVPISALYRCGGDWCVFTIEDGRAALREVAIGPRNTTAALVESGLSPGEQVVLYPNETIKPGRAVEPR